MAKKKTTHTRNKLSGIEHYNGLGMSPRPTHTHQEVLADIIAHFRNSLKKRGVNIVTETELAGPNSTAPDIVAFDNTMRPITFIEVITNKWQKKDLKKAKETMLQYGIAEAFVYNYQTDKFFSLTGYTKRGTAEIEQLKDISYSEILDIDFREAL